MKNEKLVKPLAVILALLLLALLALYSLNFSSIIRYHKATSSISENEKLLADSTARRRLTLGTGMLKLEPFLADMEGALANLNPTKVSAFVSMDGDKIGSIRSEYGPDTAGYVVEELCKYIKEKVGAQKDVLLCGVGEKSDEILFFLPNRENEEEITTFMDKLLADWRKVALKFNGRTLKVTFSAGIAFCPKHGSTTKSLYDAAEAALRVSKEKGRDRYTVYDASLLEQNKEQLDQPQPQETQDQQKQSTEDQTTR